MEKRNETVPIEIVEKRILLIRGRKVILGPHLAELYEVETRALNQAVKRNIDRFPKDFAFQIYKSEAEWLVSQNVIPHLKYLGGSLPYAFTEQGVAMLSGVLNSERAVSVNIAVMRAFVNIRRIIMTHKELIQKLRKLEGKYKKHDWQIKEVFEILRRLMIEEEKPKKRIGFCVSQDIIRQSLAQGD